MNKRRENRRPERRISGKDILCILLIIGLVWGFFFTMQMLMAPEEPGTYSFYQSPILPLSSLSGAEQLEVSRDVTLDFSTYENTEHFREQISVTDTYILHNPTAENITAELCWGINSWLVGDVPAITVDGSPVEADIRVAYDSETKLLGAHDFKSYAKALTEGNYLADALSEAPEWDAPVKVYHFYDIAYEGDLQTPVWLYASFRYGKDTNVWVRSYGAQNMAKGACELIFAEGEDTWLYVIGDDIQELNVRGSNYRNLGGIGTYPEVEGMTYQLETYESTFTDCLWTAAQEYEFGWKIYPDTGLSLVTPEMLYRVVMKQIAKKNDQLPGGFHEMYGRFDVICSSSHLNYWIFPVEIPAGGSVTVSGTYNKEAHTNSADDRHGYDIATTLGSNLNIGTQTARLVNTEPVVIAQEGAAQNFGFDPDAGITEVTLDPAVERYYIDVVRN